jgi:hypothetical protein
MKLFAHLIRADVRQFRWAVLLWLVLVAAETTLAATRPALLTDPRSYRNVSMILGLLEFAQQVGMVLLAVLVVQAHPAVGTDAFWLTRPVPPRTLFLSKIVLIATLLIVVPCTARTALMLSSHVPAREALFNAIDSVIVRAAWLAVVMAGAVVTSNFSRFALLCATVFVSLVLTVTVLLMLSRSEFSYEPGVVPQPPDPTPVILLLLCTTGAALLLAGIQYRTRLRRVSVPAGAVTVALALFAIPYWPFPLLRAPSALPAWTSDPGTVQVRAPSPVIEMNPESASMAEGGPALMSGWTHVIVSPPGRGWVVPRLTLLDASVTLEGGATFQSLRRGYQFIPQIEGSADNPERAVARQVLGVEQLQMFAQSGGTSAALLTVPVHQIASAMPARAQYTGHFAASLAHWEVATVLPLRVGAVFQEDNFRFAIGQVTVNPGVPLVVRAREWHATSSFDRKPHVVYSFYLRNVKQSHAMAGNADAFEGPSGVSLVFPMAHWASESSDEHVVAVSFYPRNEMEGQGIDWNPDWYATSELVIVRVTDAGAVLRTLNIPQASLVAKKR